MISSSLTQKNDSTRNNLRGSCILLVEDNMLNQEIVIELLRDFDVEVSVADNGREALQALQEQTFDGVLMDCSMPVMDGYEATREIRKQDRFEHLPVLAMTANTSKADREKAIEAGMNDYIAKPVDIDQMISVMAKWIRSSKSKAIPASVDDLKTAHENESAADSLLIDARLLDASLPGIDVEAGLKRVRGDVYQYRKLLELFYSNQRDFGKKFHQAMDLADFEVMERLAHSIKGVAANIAATALADTAFELEQASKARNENITVCLQPTLQNLDAVLAGIERFALESSESQAEKQHETLSAQQAEALLDELCDYIKKGNVRAAETLEKLEPVLNQGASSRLFADIRGSLANYDFEQALKILESLLKLRARE